MKLTKFILLFFLFYNNLANANINKKFEVWKNEFKIIALDNNISEDTFNKVMKDTKFLSDVIK